MTPKRIILVRYGRAAAHDDSIMYGRMSDHKIELVNYGCEQVRTVGDYIREIVGEEPYADKRYLLAGKSALSI